jgi:hypothetical protein
MIGPFILFLMLVVFFAALSMLDDLNKKDKEE